MFQKMFELIKFLKNTSIFRNDGSKKKLPEVIQFPITYKCNSRCVMCNIWKADHTNEVGIDILGNFLTDPIFKNVKAVGINGGEPSLVTELPKIAEKLLRLQKLKTIHLISNGIKKKPLLESIEKIHNLCKEHGVVFHVSISLDGVGNIQDTVRGVPNAFLKTSNTIAEIQRHPGRYCDSFDVACTVVKQNVFYLVELGVFARLSGFKIKFRLGIENRRIGNNGLDDHFSVLKGPERQDAVEFFHGCMGRAKTIQEKFKYFSIFRFLEGGVPRRLLGCMWKDAGITLDSRGDLYYCAVASKKIGSLRGSNGEKIFFDPSNLQYRKKLIIQNCPQCIHDYTGKPYFKDAFNFIKIIVFEKIWWRYYRLKCLI